MPARSSSVTADAALERLLEGNRRFVSNKPGRTARKFDARFATGQRPFAVILGCSDSRAPAEIVFDQGLGDLFVIRVAGNIVAPSLIGSVEFAVQAFDTRLVVVMGHTNCGAIAAAVDAIEHADSPSRNLRDITDRIKPHLIEWVRDAGRGARKAGSPERRQMLRKAMRSNVRNSVVALQHGSQLLEEVVEAGKVKIVGCEYELESGKVLLVK